MTQYKEKRCKNPDCDSWFRPVRFLQKGCSVKCAIVIANLQKQRATEKAQRKETRQAREKLKTLSEWLSEAQAVCNQYIRKRDYDLPCISCGRHHEGQYHAGHYRSVGACSELRFHPANIHKQCSACNNHLSGNAVEYRLRLIEKIGLSMVEWLEGPHQPQRLGIEDAKEIKQYYKEQLKWLVK